MGRGDAGARAGALPPSSRRPATRRHAGLGVGLLAARYVETGEALGVAVEAVHESGRRLCVYRGHPSLGYTLTPRATFRWFCTVKAPLTFALLRLLERAGLDADTPVSELVPAYTGGGRELIRVRHLLAHSSGLPSFPSARSGESLVEAALATPPEVAPGTSTAYNYCTAWLVAGRVVEELAQKPVDRALHDFVFEPLGLRESVLACSTPSGRQLGSRVAHLAAAPGVDGDPAWMTAPKALTALAPWNGGVGTLGDLTTFFLYVARCVQNVSHPDHDTARAMATSAEPGSHDSSLGRPVRYGLGTIAPLARAGFGRGWSEGSFGIAGSALRRPVIAAWADPARATAFAIALTGVARANVSQLHWIATALREESDGGRAAWAAPDGAENGVLSAAEPG